MTLDDLMLRDAVDREQHSLKPQDVEGLMRYVKHRISPGGFFTAVLENDLHEACARGDYYHRRRLWEFVKWLEANAPLRAWGSPEAVRDWLNEVDRDVL